MPILMIIPFSLAAATMEDAVELAVSELQENGLERDGEFEIILEVSNIHSGQYDQDARKIKSTLYSILQVKYPKAKIILEESSLLGVSFKAVLIKGTHQPKGESTEITLNAINQMSGQLISKTTVSYDAERTKNEDLIAVLPIEAPHLNKEIVTTYTNIFRSALTKTGKFNLVNSDAIDQTNADEIQEQYGCSREECSAIVAESLNAQFVITTRYNMVTDGIYFMTGSLKNINTGKTHKEEAIRHDGEIGTLEKLVKQLACQLAGTCATIDMMDADYFTQNAVPQSTPITPQIEEDDGWPWWAWAGIGIVAVGAVMASSSSSDDSSSSSNGGGSGEPSDCPASSCGSTRINWGSCLLK